MSLPELVSFAVSGSAASAVSALVTDCVAPEERRGRRRQRRRHATPSTPQSIATRSAANGLIFFFTYYVAATAQYNHDTSTDKSTGRAATDAFRTGATAFVFTRLFGSNAGPEQPAGHRWSLPALEDDALLALDPGLTFCVHEILARGVARFQARPRPGRPHGLVYNSLVAAATTFLVAAASKAIATGLLYPLHVAAAEATERRWMARDAEDEANAPLIILDDYDGKYGHEKPHAHARPASKGAAGAPPSKRQHNIVVVLLQMLRTGGVRAVYADWLRYVARAAFGHGLAMALQRSIYGYILQFILSLTGSRRAASRPDATVDAHALPPSRLASEASSKARSAKASAFPPPPPPPPPPQSTSEPGSKARNAVESWLESASGASKDGLDAASVVSRDRPDSSVVSKGTVDVDDSISNISSRASQPPQSWHTQQAHQAQHRQAPSWQSRPTQQTPQTQSWHSQPARQRQPLQREAQPWQTQPRQSQPAPRYTRPIQTAYARGPREVAGLVPSRASEPSAFYPDAAAAGRRPWSPPRPLPLPPLSLNRDFGDDDSSSLVFNMVSKSPRIIGGTREG